MSSDLLPPARRGPTGGIVVQVGDVDDHFRKASAAGAVIAYEPRHQEYGQRESEFAVLDTRLLAPLCAALAVAGAVAAHESNWARFVGAAGDR